MQKPCDLSHPGEAAERKQLSERLKRCFAELPEIHQAVMQASPNYFNMARPIRMNGTLKLG